MTSNASAIDKPELNVLKKSENSLVNFRRQQKRLYKKIISPIDKRNYVVCIEEKYGSYGQISTGLNLTSDNESWKIFSLEQESYL